MADGARESPRELFYIQPFVQAGPSAGKVLADRVMVRVTEFSAHPGFRSTAKRVVLAAKHLLVAAERGSYGATVEELRLSMHALNVCADCFHILSSLPEGDPGRAMASEVPRIFEGPVLPALTGIRSLDLLAQYWFGVVLLHAGLRPGVPPAPAAGRKHVDFRVSIDTLDCGVEVKRPLNEGSAARAMDKAARQLRDFGRPGVIVLDLSGVINAERYITGAIHAPVPLGDIAAPGFRRCAEKLAAYPETVRGSTRFNRVIAMIAFARITGWQASRPEVPQGRVLVYSSRFGAACGGLLLDQADRLCDAIKRGFHEISGHVDQDLVLRFPFRPGAGGE